MMKLYVFIPNLFDQYSTNINKKTSFIYKNQGLNLIINIGTQTLKV